MSRRPEADRKSFSITFDGVTYKGREALIFTINKIASYRYQKNERAAQVFEEELRKLCGITEKERRQQSEPSP